MINLLAILKTILRWIIMPVHNIIDIGNRIEEANIDSTIKKGVKNSLIKSYHKDIVLEVAKLIGFALAIILIYTGIKLLISPVANLFYTLFNIENSFQKWIFDMMLFFTIVILGLGAIASIIFGINPVKFEEPNEHDYAILLRFVYEALREISAVCSLHVPNYAEALKPDTWYRKGVILRYCFSCHYIGDNINIDKVARLLTNVLRRLQRDSQVANENLAVLVNITDDRDYVHFDIARNPNSADVQRMERDFKTNMRGKNGKNNKSPKDDEF